MRVIHRILLSAACTVCTADVASAQPALPRPLIRDSAGIRIIEYPSLGPEAPPSSPRAGNPFESTLRGVPLAFRMELKPYLDIGGIRDNALEELDATHPMLMAVELSDGTIVVNDKVHLKFFTRRGAFIRAVGRRGSGPGEFGQTREVCRLRGDSVLAIDYSSGRLSLWDSDGKHLQTYARPGVVQQDSCQPDGSVVVRDLMRVTPVGEAQSDRLVPYRLIRPDGKLVRQLVSLPESTPYTMAQPRPTVHVVADRILVASARSWDVRMLDFSGRVLRITRFGKPPIAITDQEWQDRTLRTIPRNSSPENTKRIKASMAYKPDAYPAYSRVRVDPVGRIWVQDFETRGAYTVLDPNGVLLGRFVLPGSGIISRKDLVGFAADHVVVLDEDGDGAMHLRFHKITPIANPTR